MKNTKHNQNFNIAQSLFDVTFLKKWNKLYEKQINPNAYRFKNFGLGLGLNNLEIESNPNFQTQFKFESP